MKTLQRQRRKALPKYLWLFIYTCGIYVLLIGYVEEKVFLVDSDPMVEDTQGSTDCCGDIFRWT